MRDKPDRYAISKLELSRQICKRPLGAQLQHLPAGRIGGQAAVSSCGPTLGSPIAGGYSRRPIPPRPRSAASGRVLHNPAPQPSRTWPKRPAQRPHLSARPPRGRSCWSKPASPAHNLSWSAPRGHNGATKQPSGAVGQTKPARAASGSE